MELPKVLSYPRYLPFDNLQNVVKNLFCYVIRHYGNDGLSVLIYRQPEKDQVVVICGDWRGNHLDLSDNSPLSGSINNFLSKSLIELITIMKLIKIEQVQFFFAIVDGEFILVDIQSSLNKLLGPGMVRDVFGKVLKTQEVLKIEILDDRAIECIRDGSGNYGGDLIIKPSKFRMYHNEKDNSFIPMYVEVVR